MGQTNILTEQKHIIGLCKWALVSSHIHSILHQALLYIPVCSQEIQSYAKLLTSPPVMGRSKNPSE